MFDFNKIRHSGFGPLVAAAPPNKQHILVLTSSSYMTSPLDFSYRRALYDIASELDTPQQKAFKFFCVGKVPASYHEVHGCEGILELITKLEQAGLVSYENVTFMRDVLSAIGRVDLIESKLDVFERERELLFVLMDYGLMKKQEGDECLTGRRSTRVAKRLMKVAEGRIPMMIDDLLQETDAADASVVKILDMFIERSGIKENISWASVAMMVVFGAEVIVYASEVECERHLKEVAHRLAEYLAPWMSENGGWVSTVITRAASRLVFLFLFFSFLFLFGGGGGVVIVWRAANNDVLCFGQLVTGESGEMNEMWASEVCFACLTWFL